MVVDEFEEYARTIGLEVERVPVGGQVFLKLKGVRIAGGTHAGTECEVAILRTTENPWVPQAAVHARPHLVKMGEQSSQASPMGTEWQYLSRRFERPPTAKSFFAHILTVLAGT